MCKHFITINFFMPIITQHTFAVLSGQLPKAWEGLPTVTPLLTQPSLWEMRTSQVPLSWDTFTCHGQRALCVCVWSVCVECVCVRACVSVCVGQRVTFGSLFIWGLELGLPGLPTESSHWPRTLFMCLCCYTYYLKIVISSHVFNTVLLLLSFLL